MTTELFFGYNNLLAQSHDEVKLQRNRIWPKNSTGCAA